jgi:hypothetical protein
VHTAQQPHQPRPNQQLRTRHAVVVLRLKHESVKDVVDGLADEGAVNHELACRHAPFKQFQRRSRMQAGSIANGGGGQAGRQQDKLNSAEVLQAGSHARVTVVIGLLRA